MKIAVHYMQYLSSYHYNITYQIIIKVKVIIKVFYIIHLIYFYDFWKHAYWAEEYNISYVSY